MEVASPARLYASAVGALLLVLGIAGFFGAIEVDAWRNFFYAASGALGLLAASFAARPFALAAGMLYTVLAIWGFALGAGEEIIGLLPADQVESWLRLAVGLLGLGAAAGTPKARRTRLKARADAAGEGA
jgi:uncharacterized membrane protein HdeD (DUF308 family)